MKCIACSGMLPTPYEVNSHAQGRSWVEIKVQLQRIVSNPTYIHPIILFHNML